MLEKFHSRHSRLLLLFLREKAEEEGRGKRIGEREREKRRKWQQLSYRRKLPPSVYPTTIRSCVPSTPPACASFHRFAPTPFSPSTPAVSSTLASFFFPLCSSYWFLWRLSPACLQTLRFRWLLAGTRRSSGGLRISGRSV